MSVYTWFHTYQSAPDSINHADHSSLGATHTVDYHDAHAYDRTVMQETTGGDGVDLIVDCHGDPALRAVRSAPTMVVEIVIYIHTLC